MTSTVSFTTHTICGFVLCSVSGQALRYKILARCFSRPTHTVCHGVLGGVIRLCCLGSSRVRFSDCIALNESGVIGGVVRQRLLLGKGRIELHLWYGFYEVRRTFALFQ